MLQVAKTGQSFLKNKSAYLKEAAASEAAGQTKEEFSGNDTSRHPKVLKVGPKLGCQ